MLHAEISCGNHVDFSMFHRPGESALICITAHHSQYPDISE